jgi:hypothetical protein
MGGQSLPFFHTFGFDYADCFFINEQYVIRRADIRLILTYRLT